MPAVLGGEPLTRVRRWGQGFGENIKYFSETRQVHTRMKTFEDVARMPTPPAVNPKEIMRQGAMCESLVCTFSILVLSSSLSLPPSLSLCCN